MERVPRLGLPRHQRLHVAVHRVGCYNKEPILVQLGYRQVGLAFPVRVEPLQWETEKKRQDELSLHLDSTTKPNVYHKFRKTAQF